MSDEMSRSKRKRSDAFSGDGGDQEGLNNNGTSNANQECTDDKWSEDLHRAFVEAIYDAGVSQSSPSVILENMSNRPASLTSERVKSHLQKYRKNRQKSKVDFFQDYTNFMRKALTVGGAGGSASHVIMPPAAMIEMMGGGKPSGGDIAAFLSYSVMTEGDMKNTASGTAISSIGIAKESQDYLKNFAGTHVPFPQLTEEEKRSPLGISMVYVMGLFSSLSQHIMHERRRNFQPKSEASDSDMPTLPVNGHETSIPLIASTTVNANVNTSTNTSSNIGFVTKEQAAATQNQSEQGFAGTASAYWGNAAMKPTHVLQPQMSQHGRGTGEGPQRRPSGLFHPILTKPELGITQNVALGGTNWNNTTQLQPAGVPAFEATLPEQPNGSHARAPPPATTKALQKRGGGPCAQV